MIGGYVTIKVISLMKTDLEKRLDTLLKDYIQTFSVTKDEIFEDPKDFDESTTDTFFLSLVNVGINFINSACSKVRRVW